MKLEMECMISGTSCMKSGSSCMKEGTSCIQFERQHLRSEIECIESDLPPQRSRGPIMWSPCTNKSAMVLAKKTCFY